MGNLLASLLASSGALRTFEQSLGVVQNNVTNSSTPGYAKQGQALLSKPFELETGLPGGVTLGEAKSYRDEFAEQTVRQHQEYYGKFAQQSTDLNRIELLFDATGASGIPGALSKLFQNFSAWSVAPNDTVARSSVIDQAGATAQNFQQAAAGLLKASADTDSATRAVVQNINRLAGSVRNYNEEVGRNAASAKDAGMDANVHATLEELSEYADFTAVRGDDGSYSVFLGGQTLLVIGNRQYPVDAVITNQQVSIRDAQGADITSQVQRGRLSSLIETKNTLIPSFLGDLNRLAKSLADQVNGTLATGLLPAAQHPLFTYGAAGTEAATLAVTNIAPAELAAAPPASPGGNSNVLQLADLGQTPVIDGYTFAGFYGSLAGHVGRTLAAARDNSNVQEQLLTQARTMREDISGVSLDEEAVHMIQFQRAYQAAARMITVLNELTGTLLSIMR